MLSFAGARGLAVGAGGVAVAATRLVFGVGSASWHLLARRTIGRLAHRGEAAVAAPMPALPAGVDAAELLVEARDRFMRLQAAWDARDLAALGALTLPEMYDDLCHVLGAIEGRTTRTDVLVLEARVVGVEHWAGRLLASVEFSGLVRESAEAGAVPFRELWMLAGEVAARPDWRLARQQALL